MEKHLQIKTTLKYYLTPVVQFLSCVCEPTDCSTLGFPVHHQLPEPAQTHVHWVSHSVVSDSLWAQSFPGSTDGKESACSAGDLSWIPGSGRCPRERNDCLLQYSCLENSVDREARWATVHGVRKSWTWLKN